jgi:hypothetical protein
MAKSTAVVTVLEFDQDAIRAREAEVAQETDQDILERLNDRFLTLREMTQAVKQGTARAMIVSGPPGVGKSYGVEEVLLRDGLFDTLAERKQRFEVVKGAMSPIGLYMKLYEFHKAGNVVVFDDCDDVLFDALSLNILKGALDSGQRRQISWNLDSRILRSEGIPNTFDFQGSAIFITNIKFHMVKSKTLRQHLDALESRCHYIDLEMDTNREKVLWIRKVVNEGMLDRFELEEAERTEILNFVEAYQDRLRELSLRMVLKIADLRKSFPNKWQATAQQTCMRRI